MPKPNAHALLWCEECKEVVGCAHRDRQGGAKIYRHPNCPSGKSCPHDVKDLKFQMVESTDPTPHQQGLS